MLLQAEKGEDPIPIPIPLPFPFLPFHSHATAVALTASAARILDSCMAQWALDTNSIVVLSPIASCGLRDPGSVACVQTWAAPETGPSHEPTRIVVGGWASPVFRFQPPSSGEAKGAWVPRSELQIAFRHLTSQ